jgi:hypothetical protein
VTKPLRLSILASCIDTVEFKVAEFPQSLAKENLVRHGLGQQSVETLIVAMRERKHFARIYDAVDLDGRT